MLPRATWAVVLLVVLIAMTEHKAIGGPIDYQGALSAAEAFGQEQLNHFSVTGPRMPLSYQGMSGLQGDIAYTYDAGLLLKFLLARGRIREARDIGDALVILQAADPLADGRWRAGYYANALYAPDGRTAAIGDPDAAVGNICHAADALVRLYVATGHDPYLQAAVRAGDWVEAHTRKDDAMGGYAVGELGWSQQFQMYRVLEHQAAVAVLSQSLFEVTGEARWAKMHDHARRLIDRLYNAAQGHYWTGTGGDDGTAINYWPIPADQVFITLLDDEPSDRCAQVLSWVVDNLGVAEDVGGVTYRGSRFSSSGQGLHSEVGAFVVAARLLAGESPDDLPELASLEDIRLYAPNHDPEGVGMVAAVNPSGASTGYGVTYPNALHLGATVAYGDALLLVAGDPYGNPFRSIPEPSAFFVVLAGTPWVFRRCWRSGPTISRHDKQPRGTRRTPRAPGQISDSGL